MVSWISPPTPKADSRSVQVPLGIHCTSDPIGTRRTLEPAIMARRHGGPRHDHVARGISGNSPSLLNGHGVTHAAEDYLACTVLACSALDDVEEYGIAEAWEPRRWCMPWCQGCRA